LQNAKACPVLILLAYFLCATSEPGQVSNGIHYRDGDGKFTEKVVLTGELNEQDLADFTASMVQSIVSGLEDRFPEGDLLDNSAIFDVASYRGKSAKEIAEYGEDEFMMILKAFQPACG
jgi:hypothetical protein